MKIIPQNLLDLLPSHKKQFDYFIDNHGQRYEAIYVYGCDRVQDLSRLEQLKDVQYILIYDNIRASQLWDLSSNIRLKGLVLSRCSKIKNIDAIPLAPSLEELFIDGGIWGNNEIESLAPLSQAPRLANLYVSAKKLGDSDITPMLQMKQLKKLEFGNSMFTTEQIALLAAKMRHVECPNFSAYQRQRSPIVTPDKVKDVRVSGKGKPLLSSTKDKKRLDKYVQQFEQLVEKYIYE